MSSRPCVGWAWRPSPALTMCTCGGVCRATRNGAPLWAWRTTKMSASIASRLAMVSSSDSPLDVLERWMSRLNTSADRRCAAISKVVRVRVEFSKNRLNTLFPRSSGTFFTSRLPKLTKPLAVSRMCSSTSRGSPSGVSRWRSSPLRLSWGLWAMLMRTSPPDRSGNGCLPRWFRHARGRASGSSAGRYVPRR
ncbi:hypothetical protein GALL_395990 [mine drainage metagenome]|uniref:Uncharacterized protein n=1 Tax=mine drainage metagenome TaxID=410659 RepID=A0A1J5QFD0_9ZZZZ